MTRVNLVPPDELTDQHLFAEWRELKMVPRSLLRSLRARGEAGVLRIIPTEFTLNAGHVCFFYDKGEYLRQRYAELSAELVLRDTHRFNRSAPLDELGVWAGLPPEFNRDYAPTEDALAIVRDRIAQRIAQKPNFYRRRGLPLWVHDL
jgi:deoxyribonuclease (pyrimidine dimer)